MEKPRIIHEEPNLTIEETDDSVRYITSDAVITHHKSNDSKIYEKALKTFGWDKQVDMLIEEMAELSQALLKFRRKGNHATFDNLCEEFVDVRIVINQLVTELPDGKLSDWHSKKMDRLKGLLELGNNDTNKY